MPVTCETLDGKLITDGAYAELTLSKGFGVGYSERVVKGIVRAFEHVERVYDDEGIAIGKVSEIRWEISTDDPQHPAIGFLPENALTRSGK